MGPSDLPTLLKHLQPPANLLRKDHWARLLAQRYEAKCNGRLLAA